MLTFRKHDNINSETHCNSKGVSLFNKNFVSLLNTVDPENWHKYQNSEGNKVATIEVSEDSVATDNEIDGFTKVGLLRKKHIIRTYYLTILVLAGWEKKKSILNLW